MAGLAAERTVEGGGGRKEGKTAGEAARVGRVVSLLRASSVEVGTRGRDGGKGEGEGSGEGSGEGGKGGEGGEVSKGEGEGGEGKGSGEGGEERETEADTSANQRKGSSAGGQTAVTAPSTTARLHPRVTLVAVAEPRKLFTGEAVDFFSDASGQEGAEICGVFGCTLPLHHQHYGGPKEHMIPQVLGKRNRRS